MGVVRAARLGRPRRARARRNWPNLSSNPVLSIMLRERKGGCPWCSPGGSCHHRQRAALAAHYTRPILPAAFCKMGAVAAATAPQVCGERGSEARSPCRHAAWLSLSAASGKAEGRRAGGRMRRPARRSLTVTARSERFMVWQFSAASLPQPSASSFKSDPCHFGE